MAPSDRFRKGMLLVCMLLGLGCWLAKARAGEDDILVPAGPVEEGDPDYLDAVLAYGQGAYAEALASLDRSIHAHPNRAEAYLLRGSCRLYLGASDPATKDFERFVSLSPAPGRSMNVVGKLFYAFDRLAEAEAWFRRALATGEEGAAARCNLGSVLLQENRPKEAERFLAEAVRLDPSLGEAHVNLGILYFLQGRLSHAEGCFKEALRLNEAAGRPDPDVYADLGDLYLVQHMLDPAVEHYTRALELDPSLSSVRTRLGMALDLLGDRAGARKAFERAIAEGGEPPEAHEALARLYLDAGRISEAVSEYKRAIHLTGEEVPSPMLALARIYAGMGRDRAALRLFQQVHDRGSVTPEILAALSRLNERCGRPEAACRYFRELSTLDPSDPETLFYRAKRCVESRLPGIRDPARAIAIGRRLAEALGRFHPGTLELLASAYAACGDYRRAAQYESEAIHALPAENPLALHLRARLERYRLMGR